MSFVKCQLGDKHFEYVKSLDQRQDTTINKYDVEIQVQLCLIRRKSFSCFLGELVKKNASKVAEGIGNVGIGVITNIGESVIDIKIGATVVFIIPEFANISGLANVCIIPRFFCFECHSALDKTDICVIIDALIPAYYTLQNRVTQGDVILVCDATTPHGQMIIQLLHLKGCKIVAYLAHEFEKDMLTPYRHMIDSYFEGWIHQSGSEKISANLLDESDGLGYSSVLYLKPSQATSSTDPVSQKGTLPLPVAISILAAGGNLVLFNEKLVLNKSMCQHLFSKACSAFYVNPTANLSSPSKLGSLINFLISKLELMEKKEIRPPQPIHRLSIDDSVSVLNDEKDAMTGSYVVQI